MLDLLMEQEDKKISYEELKRRAEHRRIKWHHHQPDLPYGRAHRKVYSKNNTLNSEHKLGFLCFHQDMVH